MIASSLYHGAVLLALLTLWRSRAKKLDYSVVPVALVLAKAPMSQLPVWQGHCGAGCGNLTCNPRMSPQVCTAGRDLSDAYDGIPT
ncbi:hypothetical protein C8Q79DRAFT_644718 [Trametes meyenii]|nr:hypothetical protein C8Q79DRAFT_644718 [Trametes meyenii]